MRSVVVFILFFLLFLVFYSNFTTIGVVLDSRKTILSIAGILIILFGILFIRKRKLLTAVYFSLSVILLILSVWEIFFRYSEAEIKFNSQGQNLYGTLYSPFNTESKCLVVFIHGSGKATRSETAFHARGLARRGISAFAYDKRGSGKSEGNVYEVGYDGYSADAIEAIKNLTKRNNFEKIGLFGISEGEWVSLIIDSKIDIDFIVLVSSSGTSPYEQTLREMTFRLEKKGFEDIAVKEAEELYSKVLRFDNRPGSRKEIEREISESINEDWFQEGEDFEKELYFYSWWNGVMDFSPEDYLKNSDTPILVLVGKNNPSYPPSETVQNYQPFPGVKVKVFKSGDHALLDWPLGENIPPPSFTDGYLETYTNWIKDNCIIQSND